MKIKRFKYFAIQTKQLDGPQEEICCIRILLVHRSHEFLPRITWGLKLNLI